MLQGHTGFIKSCKENVSAGADRIVTVVHIAVVVTTKVSPESPISELALVLVLVRYSSTKFSQYI